MPKRKNSTLQKKTASDLQLSEDLLTDLRFLIQQTKRRIAQTVNSELVILYWKVGKRIKENILKNERAEYGKQILPTLSAKLEIEFGKGFSRPNLFNMIRFFEVFSEKEIVYALSRQLTWTHFRKIIYIEDKLKRNFYAEICRIERWSTRTLNKKIDGMLYERTAISKKSDELIKEELQELSESDKLTPDLVFRDTYLLDFLNLPAKFSEENLETAIIDEIQTFLLEMGTDFSFVARQKRMTIGKDDFYLDLLFYHRGLQRLVAVELKLGKFTPEYYGKMTLYLGWLNKYERRENENSPIGLVLYSEADGEQIELLGIDKEEMRVGEYITELPSKELLETKLNEAIKIAKSRYSENIKKEK